MKTTVKVIFIALTASLLFSCTREPADLDDFDIIPSATDIFAGTAIDFTFEGTADFITFYSGEPGSEWTNYPEDKGMVVDLRNTNVFSIVYNNHGTYLSTFIASSYGNW